MDFRKIFEATPGCHVVLAPDLTILAASADYLRAFPENPGDFLAGGEEDLRASLARLLVSKSTDLMNVQRYDTRSAGGELEERYWQPANTPVLADDGDLLYIIHSLGDVTAIQAEHHRLVESNNALASTNAELEAFCYSVAHDLRAPLRGIQGFSQALLEDYSQSVDSKGQGYLQRVASAALRMSELIDDLLNLSRISRAALSRVEVDLTALARDIAAELSQHHAHRIDVVIAGGLQACADERLVKIVFENLLGNAFKFTATTADPRVEVGSTVIDGAPAFFVRDNGAGFDEAYATKLFAPFQRMHSEKEFAGTGIGLATVQRIVRRHGGRTWARSAVNAGATIYFTLPD